MNKLPYFKWYPADADTDENFRLMTDEEIGFCVRCLNHAWINGGIPAEPAERARAFKKTPVQLARLWRRVGKCFVAHPDDDSRLINRRLHKERLEANQRAEACKEGGVKSGEARRKKARQNSEPPSEPTSKQARTRASDSVSESFAVASEKENTKPEVSLVQTDAPLQELLEMFLALGRGTTVADQMRCENEWNALEPEQRHAALLFARSQLGEWQNRPTEKIAQPWNYLRERHWERAAPRTLLQLRGDSWQERALKA